jgi:hypothetical protein
VPILYSFEHQVVFSIVYIVFLVFSPDESQKSRQPYRYLTFDIWSVVPGSVSGLPQAWLGSESGSENPPMEVRTNLEP